MNDKRPCVHSMTFESFASCQPSICRCFHSQETLFFSFTQQYWHGERQRERIKTNERELNEFWNGRASDQRGEIERRERCSKRTTTCSKPSSVRNDRIRLVWRASLDRTRTWCWTWSRRREGSRAWEIVPRGEEREMVSSGQWSNLIDLIVLTSFGIGSATSPHPDIRDDSRVTTVLAGIEIRRVIKEDDRIERIQWLISANSNEERTSDADCRESSESNDRLEQRPRVKHRGSSKWPSTHHHSIHRSLLLAYANRVSIAGDMLIPAFDTRQWTTVRRVTVESLDGTLFERTYPFSRVSVSVERGDRHWSPRRRTCRHHYYPLTNEC